MRKYFVVGRTTSEAFSILLGNPFYQSSQRYCGRFTKVKTRNMDGRHFHLHRQREVLIVHTFLIFLIRPHFWNAAQYSCLSYSIMFLTMYLHSADRLTVHL